VNGFFILKIIKNAIFLLATILNKQKYFYWACHFICLALHISFTPICLAHKTLKLIMKGCNLVIEQCDVSQDIYVQGEWATDI
jgi:hypothetical protein